MFNPNELVQLVKRAAVEAVQASDPMGVCFGTVVSVKPLAIRIDQKETLTEAQLILTGNVRDRVVEMTVDHKTESVSHGHQVQDTYSGGGQALAVEHSHLYVGRKRFVLHQALQINEKVVLLRCDGGQRFIVLDRWEALS